MRAVQRGKDIVRFGVEMRWFPLYFAQELGSTVLLAVGEKIMPPPDVNKLIRNNPLHEARVGLEAVERGRDEGIPALRRTGEATTVAAAMRAVHTREVPDKVAGEIAGLIVEAGIDPHASPLVSDEAADEAEQLIREKASTSDDKSDK